MVSKLFCGEFRLCCCVISLCAFFRLFFFKAPKAALVAQAVEKSKRGPMTKAHPQQYPPPFGRLKDVSKTSVNEQAKGRERGYFQSFRFFVLFSIVCNGVELLDAAVVSAVG